MTWLRVPRVLPVGLGLATRGRVRPGGEALAGLSLAAVAVPEVLGYAKIAGMSLVAGLYTMLAPALVFAVLGSSRHLVVGADSATAAMVAAGLTGVAAVGSSHYVALGGTAALLVGGLLVLARVVRLGFLADFLSLTVLVGFLTGVGVQVAVGQLPDMLGVSATGGNTVSKLLAVLRAAPQVHLAAPAVSLSVIVVMLCMRRVTPKIPGPLLAVTAAIVVSHVGNLEAQGIVVLGPVPQGLPSFAPPDLARPDVAVVLPIAVSMFVVILAQSSATSRAYAGKYGEVVNEDTDLIGLGGAPFHRAVRADSRLVAMPVAAGRPQGACVLRSTQVSSAATRPFQKNVGSQHAANQAAVLIDCARVAQ